MVVHIRQISAITIKNSLQIHQDWQFPVKVLKILDSNGRTELSTIAMGGQNYQHWHYLAML